MCRDSGSNFDIGFDNKSIHEYLVGSLSCLHLKDMLSASNDGY